MDLFVDPSPLLVLAIVLVAGVAVGNAARLLHMPAVTGQILVGVVIGPSVLGVFPLDTIHELQPVTSFALALVAVAVGSHLHVQRLRNAHLRLFYMLLAESTVTPFVVFLGVIFLPSVSWPFALLLAALAISTAPATIMAIVKEERGKGVFVKTLVAAVALNNLACISAFELAHLAARVGLDPAADANFLAVVLSPFRQILMAALLGGSGGLILAGLTRHVVRTDLLSTYSLVAIVLTAGLADALEISSLLSCLILGVTLANVVPEKDGIGHTVFDNFESAIYAAFFTLAGMELDLGLAKVGGAIAVVVVVTRIAGKVGAGYVAMKLGRAPRSVRQWLGLALVPQAGVAVGLLLVAQEDPALGSIRQLLLAVGLAVVTANEIIGPVLTRFALRRSGDTGRDKQRLIDFIHEENITTTLIGETKDEAIAQLTDLLVRSHPGGIPRDRLLASILERERDISTCVGEGLAIPHGELPEGDTIAGVIGISRDGLHFETPDHRPVHCMVLLATPPSQRDRHLEVLAALARTIGTDRNLQSQLFSAKSPAHVCEILRAEVFEDLNYILEDED